MYAYAISELLEFWCNWTANSVEECFGFVTHEDRYSVFVTMVSTKG